MTACPAVTDGGAQDNQSEQQPRPHHPSRALHHDRVRSGAFQPVYPSGNRQRPPTAGTGASGVPSSPLAGGSTAGGGGGGSGGKRGHVTSVLVASDKDHNQLRQQVLQQLQILESQQGGTVVTPGTSMGHTSANNAASAAGMVSGLAQPGFVGEGEQDGGDAAFEQRQVQQRCQGCSKCR